MPTAGYFARCFLRKTITVRYIPYFNFFGIIVHFSFSYKYNGKVKHSSNLSEYSAGYHLRYPLYSIRYLAACPVPVTGKFNIRYILCSYRTDNMGLYLDNMNLRTELVVATVSCTRRPAHHHLGSTAVK